MVKHKVVWGWLAAWVLLSGCQWSSPRNGPGNTGFNPGETTVGLANVAALRERFRADIGPVDSPWGTPVVSNGSVYVNAKGALKVFSDSGSTGCTAVPGRGVTCTPMWTAALAGFAVGSPTVANGTVFVSLADGSASGLELLAFDANGKTGCTGTPAVCTPLWTAPYGGGPAPTVRNGLVYVVGLKVMTVFDATGTTGCSGLPKVCTPLWSTTPLPASGPSFGAMASATVSDSSVFLVDYQGGVHAYPAAAGPACAGVPVTCPPMWTAAAGGGFANNFNGWVGAVLVGSRVITYTNVTDISLPTRLSSFDANGVAGCSGVPRVCTPQWSTGVPGFPVDSQIAAANGSVFVVTKNGTSDWITSYRDDGAGCTGTPMTCPPQWQATAATSGRFASPSIANGVLYQQTGTSVGAFDASGTSCPTRVNCVPAASIPTPPGHTNIAVTNGRVYLLGTTEPGATVATGTLTVYQ